MGKLSPPSPLQAAPAGQAEQARAARLLDLYRPTVLTAREPLRRSG